MRKNIYSSITGLCFLIYKEFVELSNKKTPNRKNWQRIQMSRSLKRTCLSHKYDLKTWKIFNLTYMTEIKLKLHRDAIFHISINP